MLVHLDAAPGDADADVLESEVGGAWAPSGGDDQHLARDLAAVCKRDDPPAGVASHRLGLRSQAHVDAVCHQRFVQRLADLLRLPWR